MSIWTKFDSRDTTARNHKAQHTRATHLFGSEVDEAVAAQERCLARLRAEREAQAGLIRARAEAAAEFNAGA